MTRVWFDEQVALRYDEDSGSMYSPDVLDPAVGLLEELAGDGAALEFSIGTGSVALPLSARGVPVHEIDISTPMLEQLRRKPGSEKIGITNGDFAITRVHGTFRLVYLVYNTIMNLTTQDEQVACFENAASWHDAARALGRMDKGAFHRRKRLAHVSLAEVSLLAATFRAISGRCRLIMP